MKTTLLVMILSILSLHTQSQTQLGENLQGEDMSNLSGTAIAMNNNGNFVAVGAPQAIIAVNGGISIRGGHVRTYAYNGTSWTAGADFDAEAKGDSMGFSVAVNGDGSIIACAAPEGDPNGVNSGYVHVYIAQGDNPITPNFYIRLGEDLDGESSVDRFGQSIAINDAGTRLIVGAPGGNYVKVFQKETFADPWTQLGATLSGDTNGDLFGTSVDINAVGDRIVVGAITNNAAGSGAGRAKVYELVNGDWVQLGSNIDGQAGDQAGNTVSIDDVGDTVAVGFPGFAAPGVNNSGAVKIFDLVSNSWQQRGNSIIGRAFETIGGSGNNQQEGAVDLHAGGTRIAIGSKTYTNQNVTQSGFIAHYEFDRGVWTKTGNDVVGNANGDEFGSSVAINDSDGTIIAGGAAFADTNGNDSGYSAVYDFKTVLSISESEFAEKSISMFPNPSSAKIYIKGATIKTVDFFNISGKKIKTFLSNTIDVSSFARGIYFVKITSNSNLVSYKKLVIK
jgi:hypothetical protein